MRKVIILIVLLCGYSSYGQNVGIGTNSPASSAKLDITSTTSGILIPRMTDVQRDNIASPVKGLLVFVNNDSSFYYYDGAWKKLITDGAFTQGSVIFAGAGGKLSEKNSSFFYDSTNSRLGIGTSSPQGMAHLNGAEWDSNPLILQSSGNNVGPSIRFAGNSHTYDIIGATGTNSSPGADYFGIWDNTNFGYRFVISPLGKVGIGTTGPASTLDVIGGNWDLTATEGDLRIGNSADRLKMGVATAGAGAGDVYIKADGGTNRILLGGGSNPTILAINGTTNKISITDGSQGNNKVLTSNATGVATWQTPASASSAFKREGVFSPPVNSSLIMNFSTADYDLGNNSNTTSFTAPVTGVYHFNVIFLLSFGSPADENNYGNFNINFAKNGSALPDQVLVTPPHDSQTYSTTLNLSSEFFLNAGDVIRCVYYGGGASFAATPNGYGIFSGYRVN